MSSILSGIYVSKLDIYRSGVARVYRGHDNHLGHDSSRPIVGSHGDSVQAIALYRTHGLKFTPKPIFTATVNIRLRVYFALYQYLSATITIVLARTFLRDSAGMGCRPVY